MNRRQKIIVSITGIFIVLLALVGLTYAYFLTRITGNENDKSISVTTANLELVYGDDSAEIIKGTGALMPTMETDADDAIGTKTFTVTNKGNDSNYVVIIDNVTVTKASDGSLTSFLSNDFKYTLTCSVKDKSGNAISNESCNDVESLSIFPIKGGILVGNDIPENRVHEYILTLWYIDTGVDQSNDMGKLYQARVNIADVNLLENPFKTGDAMVDNVSLTYNIIENAMSSKNGTKFVSNPPTKVAEQLSSTNWKDGVDEYVYIREDNLTYYAATEEDLQRCVDGFFVGDYPHEQHIFDCSKATKITENTSCEEYKNNYVNEENWYNSYVIDCDNDKPVKEVVKYEKVISITQDDYGISYYFRGNVNDNYINFAGMCWRIVRIQGDGSIKLVLEDMYTTCDDVTDTDGKGNGDYAYTGNWFIDPEGTLGYGYNSFDFSGSRVYKMNYLEPTVNPSFSMVKMFYDFQNTFTENELSKLKAGDWCLGDRTYTRNGSLGSYTYTLLDDTSSSYLSKSDFYYDAYTRLRRGNEKGYYPTLKCNGTLINKFKNVNDISRETDMYVATLTVDEIVYAGAVENYNWVYREKNYYLENNLQLKDNILFTTLSPSHFGNYSSSYRDNIYVVNIGGIVGTTDQDYVGVRYRPSVVLSSDVVISGGEGTLQSPYVVD